MGIGGPYAQSLRLVFSCQEQMVQGTGIEKEGIALLRVGKKQQWTWVEELTHCTSKGAPRQEQQGGGLAVEALWVRRKAKHLTTAVPHRSGKMHLPVFW